MEFRARTEVKGIPPMIGKMFGNCHGNGTRLATLHENKKQSIRLFSCPLDGMLAIREFFDGAPTRKGVNLKLQESENMFRCLDIANKNCTRCQPVCHISSSRELFLTRCTQVTYELRKYIWRIPALYGISLSSEAIAKLVGFREKIKHLWDQDLCLHRRLCVFSITVTLIIV